jgi:hypothetical protein
MSNRLGGFIAGQNVNAVIGTFTAVTSPIFTFASTQATPVVGTPVQFTTSGTLPTGLSTNTTYYVISTSTNTCQFSTALGGSAVIFTDSSGSGTHSAVTQRAFSPLFGVTPSVEYLVVAGGGAGAGSYQPGDGGGGAGGLLQGAGYAITAGSPITITVGSGGVGINSFYNVGANGTTSVFGTISTTGGGGGGSNQAGYAGANGGSGGGGGVSVGTGTAGQGFNGGAVNGGAGGGGGGAGSIGQAAVTSSVNGCGGCGICSTITGEAVYYAGGGGGGSESGGNAGYASAGGGQGGLPTNDNFRGNGVDGLAGTGGGGGGGAKSAGGSPIGGSGGSGIVVIRYPQEFAPPVMVTGSPQVEYAHGYQIYIWTSSGSVIF